MKGESGIVIDPVECWNSWSAAQASENPTSVATPHWYGAVSVCLPDADEAITVGVWLGVPPSDEATRLAAGDGVSPYLTAVYLDPSDWEGCSAERAEEILGAVHAKRYALWAWVMPEAECTCPGCGAIATHKDEYMEVCGGCYGYHLGDDGQIVCPTHGAAL